MKLLPEQLLGEIEDLLRLFPDERTMYQSEPEASEWCGRATAVLGRLPNRAAAIRFSAALSLLHNLDLANFNVQRGKMREALQHARYDLRMDSVGPIALAVGAGQTFDYFDGVRKVIEDAATELFFVDPYLTADFVSRYLPHVKAGVSVRLLGQKGIPALLPAVDSFAQQSGLTIQLRGGSDLHDRWVIVDGAAAYQSGASFKDGGRASPTTLTQAVDAFSAIKSQYEDRWQKAQVHR